VLEKGKITGKKTSKTQERTNQGQLSAKIGPRKKRQKDERRVLERIGPGDGKGGSMLSKKKRTDQGKQGDGAAFWGHNKCGPNRGMDTGCFFQTTGGRKKFEKGGGGKIRTGQKEKGDFNWRRQDGNAVAAQQEMLAEVEKRNREKVKWEERGQEGGHGTKKTIRVTFALNPTSNDGMSFETRTALTLGATG